MDAQQKQAETMETTPAEAPLARIPQTPETAHLALFNQEKRDLIKKMICPAGITDGEFELFMLQCIRSGLDPLQKQAFCIPRTAKIKKPRQTERGGTIMVDEYVDIPTFQPAVSGMLARAEQFPDYQGTIAGLVYQDDTFLPVYETGEAHHTPNPKVNAMAKGRVLLGAFAVVRRAGRVPVLVARTMEECKNDKNPIWKDRPEPMMRKSAIAAALREAFPAQFGGLYIDAEWDSESERRGSEPPPPFQPPPLMQQVMQQAKKQEIEDGEIVAPPDEEPPLQVEEREPGADDGDDFPAEEDPGRLTPAQQLAMDVEDWSGKIAASANVAMLKAIGKQLNALPAGPLKDRLKNPYNERYKKLSAEVGK